ncbi:hypothetical protein PoB_004087300 [Plakobranchus ocellatus]|uniref:Uncharacterized protein n=1 Tax=Plakobranchus ocellatus TaxID=259542 RepID=A0AAV4B6F8_9GAST|nr:hypothetical protein PoB_004087300 [Plakobranchus ocellatus]
MLVELKPSPHLAGRHDAPCPIIVERYSRIWRSSILDAWHLRCLLLLTIKYFTEESGTHLDVPCKEEIVLSGGKQAYPSPSVIKASELPGIAVSHQLACLPAIRNPGAKPNGQHDKAYHSKSRASLGPVSCHPSTAARDVIENKARVSDGAFESDTIINHANLHGH